MKGSCLLELSGFNFPPAAIRELFSAAVLHHDDVIEYDEFVPVAEILKSQTGMKATSAPVCKAAPKKKAAMPSLGDVPPAMLQDYIIDKALQNRRCQQLWCAFTLPNSQLC